MHAIWEGRNKMPSVLDKLVPDAPGKRKAPGTVKRPHKRKPAAARKAVHGATRKGKAAAPVERAPSLWLNRLLIAAAAALVIAAGSKAYIEVEKIPVQRISVTGQLEHTQAEAVQAMVQASLAGGFLSADLQKMREQLEGLPWIHAATVRRRWPNALEIHVVEQLPIARWGANSFLNHEGGVFSSGKSGDWAALPLLVGPEGTATALMAKYQRLLDILAPLDLKVQELSVDERGQVEVVVNQGIRLVLGNHDFRERMQRFVAIYVSELQHRMDEILRIDMRYPTGVAVAFKPAESSQVAGL